MLDISHCENLQKSVFTDYVKRCCNLSGNFGGIFAGNQL